MADEGFISLTMRKGSDNAAFFSANSVQKPKQFPNTKVQFPRSLCTFGLNV
jgi:type VI secretion system protein ImpC